MADGTQIKPPSEFIDSWDPCTVPLKAPLTHVIKKQRVVMNISTFNFSTWVFKLANYIILIRGCFIMGESFMAHKFGPCWPVLVVPS
jgi:hypothetical protein